MVTTLKKVPAGTNGGVSGLGLAASLAGGAVVGLSAALTLALEQPCHGFAWEIVLVGSFAGLGGSMVSFFFFSLVYINQLNYIQIDSFLGATVQESLYSEEQKIIVPERKAGENIKVICGSPILSNHQVNFLASFLTTFICAFAAYSLYPTA